MVIGSVVQTSKRNIALQLETVLGQIYNIDHFFQVLFNSGMAISSR